VEARLARALLDLAQHFRGHSEAEQIVISHKMTQNDLAAMPGVARENVSRVLTDWRERKIVVRSSGYYCLYDVAALKRKGVRKDQSARMPHDRGGPLAAA